MIAMRALAGLQHQFELFALVIAAHRVGQTGFDRLPKRSAFRHFGCGSAALARMFHTPLYGLRADCRQSAGRARWPAHPGYRQNRPQKAPHGDRQDSKAFLSQPSFLSRLGRLVTFRRGGFALARISSDHCQQMCRMQISDRWVGKNCEICGLGAYRYRTTMRSDPPSAGKRVFGGIAIPRHSPGHWNASLSRHIWLRHQPR
jgi:hypothetical protein